MDKISWSKKIPFFRNTYLLRSVFLAYLAVIFFMSLIIGIIFIADGDADQLGEIALPFLGIYLFLLLLFLLGAWIAIGNKYALRYEMGEKGIRITGTRDKAKNIRKLAIIAGVLTAKPGLVGSGLLVRDDVIEVKWDQIKEIKWVNSKNKMVIYSSFLNQVGIHYPRSKENEIKALIRQYR